MSIRKKSKLLEKIGLRTGIIGFVAGLGFATNGLFIDRLKNYSKIEEVKSKIWNIEKAKRNLQEADTYFCSENFDNELKNLYADKSYFENTLEYKKWNKKVP